MLRINLLSRLRIDLVIYRIRSALHPVPVRLRHLARGLRLLLLLTPPRSNTTTWRVRALLSRLAPIGHYFEPEVFYLQSRVTIISRGGVQTHSDSAVL